jgi:hypothetical protein
MEERQPFEVTDAERQLIEAIRTRRADAHFRLVIESVSGAWEIEMSEESAALGKQIAGRGMGASFDQAWYGINPLWA